MERPRRHAGQCFLFRCQGVAEDFGDTSDIPFEQSEFHLVESRFSVAC